MYGSEKSDFRDVRKPAFGIANSNPPESVSDEWSVDQIEVQELQGPAASFLRTVCASPASRN